MSQALPQVLVFAPEGLDGIGVVVAACRASALGIVDLCSVKEGGDATGAFRRISRLTNGLFGARAEASEVLGSWWLADETSSLGVVCLTLLPDDQPSLESAVRAIHASGRLVLGEVTSKAEIGRAIAVGVDGLIVAGNEAGGWGSFESSFVLLQAALAEGGNTPVWVRGGIGPNVAAGCVAAGAAGVVLDGAVLLARESPLDQHWRERVARWDGSETTVVARKVGAGIRVFALPGSPALSSLRRAATEQAIAWKSAVRDLLGWQDGQCLPVGQDAALAERLSRKYVTVGGIVQAVGRAITEGIAAARAARPLAESSPLAIAHGTRFPVLQGPMTRVSDVPGFAEAVAGGGACHSWPWRCCAKRKSASFCRNLPRQLAGHPWGVGILGFVPPELRAEQLAVVREFRPLFALLRADDLTRRPGWNARESPPICTSPRRGCSTSIFAMDLVVSCSRAVNVAGTWGRGAASFSGSKRSP